ncbi:hypothetical protein L596_004206 [Steinernema carpocapsae]|uniref:Secreted protein n=1 Tax=Steinernema carpocapsae TaxID=34508 RepID=A0A4U8UV76_STECR|nr:hypothetical protein L596_004206 [Steinernema carpocapsae]
MRPHFAACVLLCIDRRGFLALFICDQRRHDRAFRRPSFLNRRFFCRYCYETWLEIWSPTCAPFAFWVLALCSSFRLSIAKVSLRLRFCVTKKVLTLGSLKTPDSTALL